MTAQPMEQPFGAHLDAGGGRIQPGAFGSSRRLSEIAHLFADPDRARALARADDVEVYSGSTAPVPERDGHVGLATTRIEPGTVGPEFFMTHGHVHQLAQAEAYITLAGHGGLLLRRGTDIAWVEMRPSVMGYIPPGWSHRTMNLGATPFTFLAVYPRLAGHDYASVAREGMGARVLQSGSGYRVLRDDGVEIAAG